MSKGPWGSSFVVYNSKTSTGPFHSHCGKYSKVVFAVASSPTPGEAEVGGGGGLAPPLRCAHPLHLPPASRLPLFLWIVGLLPRRVAVSSLLAPSRHLPRCFPCGNMPSLQAKASLQHGLPILSSLSLSLCELQVIKKTLSLSLCEQKIEPFYPIPASRAFPCSSCVIPPRSQLRHLSLMPACPNTDKRTQRGARWARLPT